MSRIPSTLLRSRVDGTAAKVTAVVRILAGLFFMLAGVFKFLAYDVEQAEFIRFGFPDVRLIVYGVGVVEVAVGLMLVLGFGTRLAALGMAIVMTGAVLTAGLAVGGPIHLGVAPALLLTGLYLLWAGSGAWAMDSRLAARWTRIRKVS